MLESKLNQVPYLLRKLPLCPACIHVHIFKSDLVNIGRQLGKELVGCPFDVKITGQMLTAVSDFLGSHQFTKSLV